MKVRKALFEGGKAAVDAAKDPMIEVARLLDPTARKARKKFETEVEEPKRQAAAAIAKARFALDGTNTYPDATFTLRLSFGTVSGFSEAGKMVPVHALRRAVRAVGGAHQPAAVRPPKRWEERREPRPEHPAQLRLHRRHHWREFGARSSTRPARWSG